MQNNLSRFFDRDTLLHLRLPFSFFLLPVFCFAISQSVIINEWNTVIVFVVLHFFIYPGSNIYNSFMDKDKGSIGGLKNPPPVTKKMYYVSIIFDSVGLLLCFLISYKMVPLMLVYISISKAYSWKKIRLKKYAITGWLVVMLFQGGYTYLLVNMAAENLFSALWFNEKNIACMALASLLIGASYPLTQVYQHAEDHDRGDNTISYMLGIKGTFVFTGVLFLLACIFAFNYFKQFYTPIHFYTFILCLLPVICFYFYWLGKAWVDKRSANYINAMRMTFLSSTCMIICFSILFFLNQ